MGTAAADDDPGREAAFTSEAGAAATASAAPDASPRDRPGGADDEAAQLARLQHGQRTAELTLEQLWLRFFAVGGDAGLVELEAYLTGLMPLPARQRDMLAQAVNERLDELLFAARVPYSHPPPAGGGSSRATAELAGMVGLLDGSHLAPPDELPALASAAYRSLGVDVTIYLVDHDQRLLVPLLARETAGDVPTGPLGVDATLAGRAFRQAQTTTSDQPGQRRLWLPLRDGAERLGVLDVRVPGPADLDDAVLRAQCEHLAGLLGHLVTSLGGRGDALDSLRHTRPRAPSDELLRQLLPPASATTDSFALSGWLEPADVVGGDTFDYALSPDRASLAVFDAVGHGLPAGLTAAAAVSAYRAARRDGHPLLAQARVVDACIAALSREGSSVTGFLGELDLATGRLTYLSAGHPQPLLLRRGRLVRTLGGGRRVPFGQDPVDPPDGPDRLGGHDGLLGQEDLEPGDWVVVHTDGVTEARDATGEPFGDARLADALQDAAAAGRPPPETARRLARAVLAHQDGRLQDDATVLLTCWRPR